MRLLKALLLVAVIAAALAAYVVLAPFGPSSETFVDIAPGTSTAGIAQQLKQAGIIRSATAFEAMKLWRGAQGRSLKAGEYRFDHPARLAEVYDRIARGDVFTISLVIPEGFNIFDIAQAAQNAGLAQRDAFLHAEIADTPLIAAWSPHAASLEGFLFPDTYRFNRHSTPDEMVAAMVRRFTQVATRLNLTEQPASPSASTGDPSTLLPEQVVTLASLVEREVHIDSERPVVAGVFLNRLAQGMPLQTDPSVVYASLLNGTWTGVIHQSELHAPSDYNTYTHTGLPPGPICNPGLAALEAALHPAHTDFLYFVADANGQTRFASSLAEHNANVAAYRAATGQAAAEPQTTQHAAAGHNAKRRPLPSTHSRRRKHSA